MTLEALAPPATALDGNVRLKLRFQDAASMNAALATEDPGAVAVHMPRRRVVSFDVSADRYEREYERADSLARDYGATLTEDYRFDLERLDAFDPEELGPEIADAPSLDDVIDEIRAKGAWAVSWGRNVVIAVVDSGIDGSRPEFGPARRVPESWAPAGMDPWVDERGHGTMCAAIAAGSRADGGAFDGVAPEARIMSCRTKFYDAELAAIYDQLADLARTGAIVIATNSWGIRTGTPPVIPADLDFLSALDDAVSAGVSVFFSAGNYHALAGGTPDADEPNSIWLHKSREDVMTVGACDLDRQMWNYSSRGLGQHYGDPNTNQKPDVVGATPAGGRIVYGGGIVTMPNGWGTSGCCPQAAGLGALLASKRSAVGGTALAAATMFDAIRSSARPLGRGWPSQGAGLIDCVAALAMI